jgi:hypothetical protein
MGRALTRKIKNPLTLDSNFCVSTRNIQSAYSRGPRRGASSSSSQFTRIHVCCPTSRLYYIRDPPPVFSAQLIRIVSVSFSPSLRNRGGAGGWVYPRSCRGALERWLRPRPVLPQLDLHPLPSVPSPGLPSAPPSMEARSSARPTGTAGGTGCSAGLAGANLVVVHAGDVHLRRRDLRSAAARPPTPYRPRPP